MEYIRFWLLSTANIGFFEESSFAYFSFKKSRLFGGFLFERCADCVCAGRCVAGTYVDRFGCASRFAVMVNAVGNVANDAVIASASVLVVFIIVHFEKLLSVSSYIFCTLCTVLFALENHLFGIFEKIEEVSHVAFCYWRYASFTFV